MRQLRFIFIVLITVLLVANCSFPQRIVSILGVPSRDILGLASAQTATSSEKWNLEGTWQLSVGYFQPYQDGRCVVKIPTGGAGAINSPIAISKSASGYSV